jgi:hypothetical protein
MGIMIEMLLLYKLFMIDVAIEDRHGLRMMLRWCFKMAPVYNVNDILYSTKTIYSHSHAHAPTSAISRLPATTAAQASSLSLPTSFS